MSPSVPDRPTEATSICHLDLASERIDVLRRSSEIAIEPGYLSIPEAIEFPTEQGPTAYAFFYGPENRDYVAPEGELPPLIVKSHGGPTSSTSSALKLEIQYWTSRGFGVLDVNYGGSTGYGRAYRGRLDGQWGVVDVDDCASGARYLVERGEVDGDRLVIKGGSAGGYTTLCALAFRDVFQVGASYYGVSDLEALTRETHKFESRYLDRLIGPYPECRDLYRERSPIHFYRSALVPDDPLPGARRRSCPAQSGRVDGRGCAQERIARRIRPVRGRAARFPQRPEHKARPRR